MAGRAQRGPREAVTADIGRVGRLTGRVMPKEGEIPLTQDGFEDIDAFFKSPPPPESKPSSTSIPLKSASKRGPAAAPASLNNPPGSAGRRLHQRRPDVTADIGVRGRKTGALIAPPSNGKPHFGMDDPDAYFTQEPESVAPLSRRKAPQQHQQQQRPRISEANTNKPDANSDSGSENEPYDEGDNQQSDGQDEESEEDEQDAEDQTANYGSRGKAVPRVSKASSKRKSYANTTVTEAASDDDEDEEGEGSDLESQRGRRVSQATSRANTTYGGGFDPAEYYDNLGGDGDDYADDDDGGGGTQTMELETSSYFNKSARTVLQDASTTVRSVKKSTTSVAEISRATRANRDAESEESDDEAGLPPAPSRAQASTSKQNRIRAREPSEDRGESSGSDEEVLEETLARKNVKGKGRQQIEEEEGSDGDSDVGGDANQIYGYDNNDNDDQNQPMDDGGYPDYDNEDDDAGLGGDLDPVQEEDEEQDEDEEGSDAEREESVQLPPPLSAKKDKAGSKRKRGGDDSGHVEEQEEDDEEENRGEGTVDQSNAKKAKGKGRAATGTTTATRQKRKRAEYEEPEGVRRSQRDRTSPVEFWRNEHVMYRRADINGASFPEKMGVFERPKPPVRHLGVAGRTAAQRARAARAKTRSASAPASRKGKERARNADGDGSGQGQAADWDAHDWAEWDANTDADGIVWDYAEGKETKDRIAFTRAMMDPKPTKNHGYKFQRIFTDGDFMAAGILVIPANESKPLKPARDNTYVIQCITGAVRVLCHRTEFSIGPGGMFKIPRGNSYQINNLTDIDATLTFFQAREINSNVEGTEAG